MNKQQLAAKIWESANKLRSKIEGLQEYQNSTMNTKITYSGLFFTNSCQIRKSRSSGRTAGAMKI